MKAIDPRICRVIERWYWMPWDFDLTLEDKIFLIDMVEAGADVDDVLFSYFPEKRNTNNAKDRLIQFLARAKIHDIAKDGRIEAISHWREFESIVAELLYSLGFEVELTRRTRDGGVDIIAVRNYVTNDRYLIQCKYSEHKISVSTVREVLGVLEDAKATKAIVVTTQGFTPDAKAFIERNNWRLEGKDFSDVLSWVEHYASMTKGNF
jgi:restriction endonuclease Mrr